MPKRIGIVGGGQLGRMMTEPALAMGYEVIVVDPTPNSPAAQVGARQIIGDFDDEAAIRELAGQVDFLTFEIELANAKLLEELTAQGLVINPSAKTLSMIKDKLGQKEYLREAGIPVADFLPVDSGEDAREAAAQFGYPFLLKSRFGAYDGRGNALVENESRLDEAFDQLGGEQLYAERFVPFTKELAMMAARDMPGNIALYPLVETVHRDNILHEAIVPAPVPDEVADRAHAVVQKVMEHLDGAGVFGIELFLTAEGEVLVNELAPRVHNSGHYTIEACATSQFAQHIRAVTGQDLGPTNLKVPAAVMMNILGDREGEAEPQGLTEAAELGATVHIYGKATTKPQRKMGHLTVTGEDPQKAWDMARQARKRINI